jgi:hypothetical protein
MKWESTASGYGFITIHPGGHSDRPHISVRRFASSFGRCLVRRLSLHSGYGVWPGSA